MKKLNFLLIVTFLIISCNQLPKDEFEISGTITGVEEAHMIVLERVNMEGDKLEAFDSVTVKSGKFTFKGKLIDDITIGYITPKDMMERTIFFLENGKITLSIEKDSMINNKSGGTFNNNKLQEYNDLTKESYREMIKYQEKYQQEYYAAMQNGDQGRMTEIMQGSQNIGKKIEDINIKFIGDNPNAFLSLLMIDNLTNQPEYDLDKFKNLFSKIDAKLKETKLGKLIQEKFESAGKIEVGMAVPDFSGPTPEGNEIRLSEQLGKVTIIDFWASWCGPCRKENPEVVKLYNEFKSKGLQIIGVSLDRPGTDDKWKDAIKADNLTWPQISHLKGGDEPIAKKYNVNAIPATFIIDEQGILLAQNLRGEELRQKIAELLN